MASTNDAREPRLHVQLLGPLTIRRGAEVAVLPPSRKVRALIAYIALAPRPVSRDALCELVGEGSSDPRAEVSWCLSKIRGVLDDAERPRLITHGAAVALELADCDVDMLAIDRAIHGGLDALALAQLEALAARHAGEFLEALELERSPLLHAWLVAQRRHARSTRVAILAHWAQRLPPASPARIEVIDRWLGVAATDRHAHELLLATLAHQGRHREGEEHLIALHPVFEAEGLDARPLQHAWQQAVQRARLASPARIAASAAPPAEPSPRRRASIAIMPFADPDDAPTSRALVHDVIARLAKLRSLSVIAEGSVFALAERGLGPALASKALDVDYVVSGAVRRADDQLVVALEMSEARTNRLVWTDELRAARPATLHLLDDIGTRLVAAIADEAEAAERNLAVLKPPSSLDAWQAHHRGMWHMYRFTADDNEAARRCFELAVQLDPTFARAHAGLAWTHRQAAVVHGVGDPSDNQRRALEAATEALAADARDPAAHWAMGLALWGHGPQDPRRHADAIDALEQAVALSPSYATAYNMLAFVQSQVADPRRALAAAHRARQLSPYDPAVFVPLVALAIAHLRLDAHDEASSWALQAARRPNAHVHVKAIAAHCLLAAGRLDDARAQAAAIRSKRPDYTIDDYLAFYRFTDDASAWCRAQAPRLGL